MGILSNIGSWIFNIRYKEWIDLEGLKGTTRYLGKQLKTLTYNQKPPRQETYEEALQRLQLTEEIVQAQSRRYFLLILLFLTLSFLVFCYFLWLCFLKNVMGSCMAFSLVLYGLTIAFRYHFWHYQIQRKKLDCTLREWFTDLLKKGPVREIP